MLRLVYALLVDLLLLLLWPLREIRRRRAAPRGAWLSVEIDGPVVEVGRRRPFWDRRPRAVALHSLRRVVRAAADDPRVAGVLLTVRELHGTSATATSLRGVIEAARAVGKRVAVYLPRGGGTRETYVACAADLVLLGPETHLAPLGFAIQAPYVRDALDKIGLEPEVFARGRYKTAGESLVLREMSDAQREQIGELLESSWTTLLDAIVRGRRVEREVAEEWIHGGPWAANVAVHRGLADAVCYGDEVGKKLEPKSKDGAVLFPATRYARRRTPRYRPLLRPKAIGVVEVRGVITHKSASPLVEMADERQIGEAIESAADDPRILGVVVHIDSRGGSALASDRVLHEVRRLAGKKPVVAYLGDVAASGGYMVAVGAQSIVAQPTTITGSIGVVAARAVVEPLLRRMGVVVNVLKRGDRADMMSPLRHLDEGERRALDRELDDLYGSFLRAVAEGRRRAVEEIEPLAGGRVWSGSAAARNGLIDALGGFDVALERVRALVGRGADRAEPCLITPRRLRPSLGALVSGLLVRTDSSSLPRSTGLVALVLAASRERVWAWSGLGEMDLGGS